MGLVAQTLRECCSDLRRTVQLTDEAYLGRKRQTGIDDRQVAVFYVPSEDEIRVVSGHGTRPYRTANPAYWTKNKDLESEVIHSCSPEWKSFQVSTPHFEETTVLIVDTISRHISMMQQEDYEYPPSEIFVLPSKEVIVPALTQLVEWHELDSKRQAEEKRRALQVPSETLKRTTF